MPKIRHQLEKLCISSADIQELKGVLGGAYSIYRDLWENKTAQLCMHTTLSYRPPDWQNDCLMGSSGLQPSTCVL